jgi:hypothetical protein
MQEKLSVIDDFVIWIKGGLSIIMKVHEMNNKGVYITGCW